MHSRSPVGMRREPGGSIARAGGLLREVGVFWALKDEELLAALATAAKGGGATKDLGAVGEDVSLSPKVQARIANDPLLRWRSMHRIHEVFKVH